MTPLVTAPHASARPVQRAGHIGTDDNRYCGAAVFGALAASATSQLDLTARAFGLRDLTDADREVLRVISLGLTSPDARVWPLKLTRVLAAYGNPYAGYFGAQLGTGSQQLGPGVTAGAAASLAWIRARVGDEPSDAAVAAAVAAHAAERGRIGGFGVPFRAEDERLIGMYKLLSHHPARRRPSWRLMEQVVHALREAHGVAPNIVIAIAALVLDLGLAPHRAGLFVASLMSHTFAAHAVEAAEQDGPWLQALPRDVLDDRSRAPRRSPAAEAAAAAGSTAASARRTLAW